MLNTADDSHGYRLYGLSGYQIVSVATPKLMSIFGAGIDPIQWVTTACIFSAGVTIPVTGYFGDWLVV